MTKIKLTNSESYKCSIQGHCKFTKRLNKRTTYQQQQQQHNNNNNFT